jgi:DNA-binding transcriptional LysR family regulator
MQIETFKIFCDLVETGSFSLAASRNGITQSAVSQQIRVLEEKFGSVFFERGGKKFAVTPEGEIFEKAAREIVAMYEGIDSRLHDLRDEVKGPLRLSTVYSIGLHHLPEKLETFRKLHPDVDVVIEYRRSPGVYDDVLEGRADLGLVAYPQRGKGVIAEVFEEDSLVLICAPTHPLAKRRKVKLRELDGEKYVAFEPDTPTRKAIDRAVKQHGVTFAQQHEFDTIETVKRAVEVAGVISIVPRHAVEKDQAAGRLCLVTLEDVHLLRPLGMLRKQARVTTPAMREFMRVMLDGASAGDAP